MNKTVMNVIYIHISYYGDHIYFLTLYYFICLFMDDLFNEAVQNRRTEWLVKAIILFLTSY